MAIGLCFTLRHWSVTRTTVVITRTFKIAIGTDSSSAKAIMQRLEPGRRAKHLEIHTLRVQQLVKIGLVSFNKVDSLENVADVLLKHVPRAVLDKLAGMMGYTFSLVKKLQSFKRTRTSIRIVEIRELKKMKSGKMKFAALWTNDSSHDSRFEAGC